ncbi:unnamed protein product [Moneuplotes crassus]|uniref:HMG box domain-containing protein n=1 Tax=Euplotes crassus TaxID=5936 RepID=A0AAD1U828_EUPCR|nr:unnamed protein product [Moneuplotes crassus]
MKGSKDILDSILDIDAKVLGIDNVQDDMDLIGNNYDPKNEEASRSSSGFSQIKPIHSSYQNSSDCTPGVVNPYVYPVKRKRGRPRKEEQYLHPSLTKPGPIGVRTPYNYYVKEQKDVLRDQFRGVSLNIMLSQIGVTWNSMTEQEKKPYVALSRQDRIRYELELQQYNAGNFQNQVPEKPPSTAFEFFCCEKKTSCKKSFPNFSEDQIIKHLQTEWNLLSAQHKDHYHQLESQEQERLKRALARGSKRKRGRKSKAEILAEEQAEMEHKMRNNDIKADIILPPISSINIPQIEETKLCGPLQSETSPNKPLLQRKSHENYVELNSEKEMNYEDLALSSQSSQEIQDIDQLYHEMLEKDPDNVIDYTDIDSEDLDLILNEDTD